MSKTSHSSSYTLWSWIVAIFLVLSLFWTWWVGYGPSHKCCAAHNVNVTASPAPSATLDVNWSVDGKVTLRGVAPSEAVKKVWLDAAAQTYGADNVVDQITINPATSAPLTINLKGEVNSEQAKQQRQEQVIAIFKESTISNQLLVMQPAPAAANTQDACTQALAVAATFKTGSAKLTSEASQKLKASASCIQQAILIAGHTDNVGQSQRNMVLSERRAKAVANYLISQGVNASLLRTQGFGDTQPVADNTNPEGRAQNRRIVFSKL